MRRLSLHAYTLRSVPLSCLDSDRGMPLPILYAYHTNPWRTLFVSVYMPQFGISRSFSLHILDDS